MIMRISGTAVAQIRWWIRKRLELTASRSRSERAAPLNASTRYIFSKISAISSLTIAQIRGNERALHSHRGRRTGAFVIPNEQVERGANNADHDCAPQRRPEPRD